MKVSLKWLKEYVDTDLSPAEIANRLTMAGNEVKAIQIIGENWGEKIVIGQIEEVKPHPNADRLRLVRVNLGKEERTVVCGAPNLNVGDKVVFAFTGAELKDGHTGEKVVLKSAKIRGVESAGMICSEMELGISDEHQVIMVLPQDAPVGMTLLEYMGDTILDLDITPNRADCLSVIGIAREVAALTGKVVREPEIKYIEKGSSISEWINIEIFAPDLCPRYSASLIHNVRIKPSPRWMQERLVAAGMRPINNIVDISNYVMLEYGQPLHTFDYDKLRGRKIIVRRAQSGESIVSLDGIERKLTPDMLVIADAERAVAVAGVMGGANSEVTDQTTSILLEAANFNAASIRRTGGLLNIASEARYRFERGISPGLTIPALRRATQLIAELGEGEVARGYLDIYPGQAKSEPIVISSEKVKRFLGVEFSQSEILSSLTSLGFECKVISDTDVEAKVPYWRNDIHVEEDLIEEVARVQGYDKIPVTLLASPIPSRNPDPLLKLKQSVREVLASSGFTEILTFSMVGLDMLKKLSPDMGSVEPPPVRIANPMTADMEYLRTSLRANVLSAFAMNRRFEEGSIRIFEAGKVYLPAGKRQPEERETICGVMGGQLFAGYWQESERMMDFYDAKGTAETVLERLGLSPQFALSHDPGLHPNKQAEIIIDSRKAGIIGEVHPKVLAAFEIEEPVYLIEFDLNCLVSLVSYRKAYQPVPRFPSITRDIAIIIDRNITHQKVKETIQGFPLVEMVEIFDMYMGEQVPPGKKSLAYHIRYRAQDHTLTDEEVNQIQENILQKLNADLGAVLRR